MTPQARITQQAHREALTAIVLALCYLLWWYISAYGFSAPQQDTTMPTLYWGLPLWFLLSCIIGPILFTVLCAAMVKIFYRDIPLDPMARDTHE
ncbi:DUF997 family protein [Vibrio sp. V27_P1S3P104]|uniref:YhdT family protein n=1 Tax=unclassified Vibrio TaxID=2614977 RepID=UPI0013728397|nr:MULTISPECIES: YhdT family protein [unclassified Vibrio]NAW69300.1 DUF997 family protein [Vibrio sp. V28_P6S34P95]NAX05651.1 DUF997 family protein [Vibrio sp. V30_P3S12P165]NAX33654.1 DUF997 family protein [Vibrio sp. V29_P1S30P107]NAX38366.1 DUF997 family protein [Vibrio sp. V27_P1S3P104]NAX41368.1 DUF997 family protein [Vibrio sp. V26_P1S5P106]